MVEATSDPRRFRLVVERFRAAAGPAGAAPWQIPARLRVDLPGGEEVIEVLVGATPVEVVTARPPVWLHPNADERGYYRWRLPAGALAALVGPGLAALGDRERVAAGHLWALLEAGRRGRGRPARDALAACCRQPQRAVVSGPRHAGQAGDPAPPDSHQEAFAARIRAALSPRLAALGLEAPGRTRGGRAGAAGGAPGAGPAR
ncbi:MAG: hypothetical protein R3F43_21530 [bacterium]